jgi:7-cyano-7-deazaguanine reductase
MRYGEEQIAHARLQTFDNRTPQRDYEIAFTCPEFTCLCPLSGFPDFATLYFRYIPDQRCVELKSLKLYINRYRNEYVFHEDVANRILDDFVAAVAPRWVELVADFNVRGNIKTVITARHQKEGYVRPALLGDTEHPPLPTANGSGPAVVNPPLE